MLCGLLLHSSTSQQASHLEKMGVKRVLLLAEVHPPDQCTAFQRDKYVAQRWLKLFVCFNF